MAFTSLARLFGTKADMREQAIIALLMLAVTLAYEGVSMAIVPGFSVNAYELIGTWTGLVCVWLSRTRNILCWPWGIVSAAALGVFFMQIGLPGQQWLNWGYFLVIQLWAWPYWGFGGEGKTELPVTKLTWYGRVIALFAVGLGAIATYYVIDTFVPGSSYPVLDATVVSASVAAQYLLGRKKVESWLLWLGPVNLISIILFLLTGAYTVAALYVAFFIHAVFALRTWSKAEVTTNA